MSDFELRYRPGASHDGGVSAFALGENECTMFRGDGDPRFTWHLRFCYRRKTDGQLRDGSVPVFPNQDAPEKKPGWGLKRVEGQAGRWQVSPSIKITTTRPDPADPQKNVEVELWHETPAIVDVPDEERWTHA